MISSFTSRMLSASLTAKLATQCMECLMQLLLLFLIMGHSLLEWRPRNGELCVGPAALTPPHHCLVHDMSLHLGCDLGSAHCNQ